MDGILDRITKEWERRGIRTTQWKWLNADYSRYAVRSSETQNPAPSKSFGSGWFGKKIVLTPDQRVYGRQQTEWGRGASDSHPSDIWVVGQLLEKLTIIPGVYVFHGMKSPGSRWLDVEQAVTHGNNVYLIDPWLDLLTDYGWQVNRKGRAFAIKGDDGHRHTRIADAAERYRAALGPGVNVIPIMTIVSGKATISGERWSPRGVGLFTAEELLSFIGDASADNLSLWHDNPYVREAVVSTMVR